MSICSILTREVCNVKHQSEMYAGAVLTRSAAAFARNHFKTLYSPLKSRPLTRPVALLESTKHGRTENTGLNYAPQPLAMYPSVLVK